MRDTLEHIWSRLQAELAQAVGEPLHTAWLKPLEPVEIADGVLVVQAPPGTQRWVAERFGRVLADAAARAAGEPLAVHVLERSAERGATTYGTQGTQGSPASRRRRPGIAASPEHTDEADQPGPLGNPKLTFDQFVIGDSNRLAHAAALTVAEMPAQAYNPLFICGPPGVGKTHLLSSIANLLTLHNPELTVRLATGEAFTNAFMAALARGRTDSFKARFRHVDVLLIDDVQFLERKTRTEEEFLHTFNTLYDGGRQIVITSDKPPADLQALEDRLRERFQAGLVADIAAPDRPTRLAILRKRAQHDRVELVDPGTLELIADRVRSDVRTLEGALIRVVAYGSLTSRPLTADLTRSVLDKLYPEPSPAAARSIDDIQRAACAQFGVTREELLSPSRSPRVAWPRQVAMYLARALTDESLPAIGRHFGGRDHTTVMHACRRAGVRLADDDAAREAVEKLCAELGADLP